MFKKKILPEQATEAQEIKQEINNPGTVRKLQPAKQPDIEETQEQEEEKAEEQETEEMTEEDMVKAMAEERNLLLNHEARISAIEAALFRLKALI